MVDKPKSPLNTKRLEDMPTERLRCIIDFLAMENEKGTAALKTKDVMIDEKKSKIITNNILQLRLLVMVVGDELSRRAKQDLEYLLVKK